MTKICVEWSQSMKLVLNGTEKLGYLIRDTPLTRKYKPVSPKMEVRKFSNLLMVNENDGPFHCKVTLIPPAGKDSWEVVKTFYSKLESSSLIYELMMFLLWKSKQGCHNLLQCHGYFSFETKFKKWKENGGVYVFQMSLWMKFMVGFWVENLYLHCEKCSLKLGRKNYETLKVQRCKRFESSALILSRREARGWLVGRKNSSDICVNLVLSLMPLHYKLDHPNLFYLKHLLFLRTKRLGR